jgi:hypothetical protein
VSNRIAERASAIRDYLCEHPDRSLVRKYGFVAARYEEMKLAQLKGETTPAEDVTFREVTEMLRVLTQKLGLGDSVTGWNDYLPRDPQRLLNGTWLESARMWFP